MSRISHRRVPLAAPIAPPELSSDQWAELRVIKLHGWIVRGLQVFLFGVGFYNAFWGRGWACFGVCLACMAWCQTGLPERPKWLEEMLPNKR